MIVLRIALLVLVAGCSVIGVQGPPTTPPEHGIVDCSTSYVLPIVDTLEALPTLPLGAVMIATSCNGYDETGLCHLGELIGAGVMAFGLIEAVSAGIGFSKVSRCNSLHPEERRRVAAAEDQQRWGDIEAALLAARQGDCATVRRLRSALANSHAADAALSNDAAVAACLAQPTPTCFDETTDATVTHVCLPSLPACQRALVMLPPGTTTSACK